MNSSAKSPLCHSSKANSKPALPRKPSRMKGVRDDTSLVLGTLTGSSTVASLGCWARSFWRADVQSSEACKAVWGLCHTPGVTLSFVLHPDWHCLPAGPKSAVVSHLIFLPRFPASSSPTQNASLQIKI